MPTKVHIVKATVFPIVMYGYESWTIKKAEHWRIDAFELWCYRRLLRIPWTARRSNQSILKGINAEYSLEDWSGNWSSNPLATWCEDRLIGKDPDTGKDWRQQEKGTTEDEMVGWHHRLDGHEFEHPGDDEGQGSLVCCSLCGRKVGHNWVTEQKQQFWGAYCFCFFLQSIVLGASVWQGLSYTFRRGRRYILSAKLAVLPKPLKEFPLKESLHSGDFTPRNFSQGNN